MKAWADPEGRQSKRLKDLTDIVRLVEAHPELWTQLSDDLRGRMEPPGKADVKGTLS